MNDATCIGTKAEEEVLVMGVAEGGDEVADMFEFIDQAGEMGGGEGIIPVRVGHREAQDRDARRGGPGDELHGGEGGGDSG
jgi:hypothetical protein